LVVVVEATRMTVARRGSRITRRGTRTGTRKETRTGTRTGAGLTKTRRILKAKRGSAVLTITVQQVAASQKTIVTEDILAQKV
jgi:hypothetical protein